jgi:hypothetical protein
VKTEILAVEMTTLLLSQIKDYMDQSFVMSGAKRNMEQNNIMLRSWQQTEGKGGIQ